MFFCQWLAYIEQEFQPAQRGKKDQQDSLLLNTHLHHFLADKELVIIYVRYIHDTKTCMLE